jgi:sugar phosphate isomerase/epimerase
MKATRRQFLAASAAIVAASARTRGMQLHLSAGALGIKAQAREILDGAARHGFDVIDADRASLAALSAAEMRDKNVGWGPAGLPVDFRHDDAGFGQGIAALPDYARTLQQAGVTRVTTWLSPASNDLTYIGNFRVHVLRLREIARILNDRGVRFGLEYVGPKTAWASQRYPFVHTMREMKELLAEINQSNAGFVLDSWHWYNSHETKQDILSLRNHDIVSVDLNDAPARIPIDAQVDNRRELPAATGVIDINAFLGGLEQIGYDGPVRAEPFNEAVRTMPFDECLTATMNALKAAFAG